MKMVNINLPKLPNQMLVLSLLMGLSPKVFAYGDLPFVSSIQTIQRAISGPFLLSACLIMVVVTCLMLAFGEWSDGFRKMLNIALWLGIAFGATDFISSVFGY
jgi:type IV secretory pathway VirB2 component (pilin)